MLRSAKFSLFLPLISVYVFLAGQILPLLPNQHNLIFFLVGSILNFFFISENIFKKCILLILELFESSLHISHSSTHLSFSVLF